PHEPPPPHPGAQQPSDPGPGAQQPSDPGPAGPYAGPATPYGSPGTPHSGSAVPNGGHPDPHRQPATPGGPTALHCAPRTPHSGPAMPPAEPAAAHDGSHQPASSASRLTGQPVDPPPDAGHSDEAGQSAQWRRVHRVTPLLNTWKVGAAVFLIAMFNAQEFLADLRAAFPAMAILGLIVALIVVAFVVGLIISVLAWRRTTYGVSE